ncbi:hypothetical protein F511_03951 [Dorcoceras hygrometricum]|uniref:Uncharacterized protein n=1 Tax=Dorcoceras hygrometricum TaxID=472368 RepID=A0A2Z7C043_9LAMI|nr:hypothetical protein F511_03951 [Dorcoceras hygrometricum]
MLCSDLIASADLISELVSPNWSLNWTDNVCADLRSKLDQLRCLLDQLGGPLLDQLGCPLLDQLG